MKLRTLWFAPLALATVLMTTSCGEKKEDDNQLSMEINDQLVQEVSDVIITLPSPLELASLLKKSESAYNGTIINSPDNYDKYTDGFTQAFNMGVYGADLGYVAYYDKTQEATNYLTSINKLGTSLQVLGAFEADLLENIEKNISNQDSLLRLITVEFDKAEEHLNSVQRADAATAILAGGWIEGLYLATQINKAAPNELVRERIGETKLSLNSLLQLLTEFSEVPEYKALYDQLLELRTLYDAVEIAYGGEAPAQKGGTKPGEGLQVVEGTQTVDTGITSTVNVSDETIAQITEMVAKIRNQYTNVQ